MSSQFISFIILLVFILNIYHIRKKLISLNINPIHYFFFGVLSGISASILIVLILIIFSNNLTKSFEFYFTILIEEFVKNYIFLVAVNKSLMVSKVIFFAGFIFSFGFFVIETIFYFLVFIDNFNFYIVFNTRSLTLLMHILTISVFFITYQKLKEKLIKQYSFVLSFFLSSVIHLFWNLIF